MSDIKKSDEGNNGNTDIPREGDFTKDPLKDKIGSNLRKMYDDVLNEPIPDDFLSLLEQADKK